MKSLLALAVCALSATLALAQGVYVTPGENGPLFSDQPRPGARAVSLPPLTVVAPPPATATAAPPAPSATDRRDDPAGAVPFAYRAFAIVQPAKYGSAPADPARFAVRMALDPPLQVGAGHAFAVRINARPVEARFAAAEFTIPPQFWSDFVAPPGQLLQIEASVVDRDGREIKVADPVRFFLEGAPRGDAAPQ